MKDSLQKVEVGSKMEQFFTTAKNEGHSSKIRRGVLNFFKVNNSKTEAILRNFLQNEKLNAELTVCAAIFHDCSIPSL